MGRPCGAGFFVRLLFLVRSLVRAALRGAGMLSAMRTRLLSGTCRLCAPALCCARLRARRLCAGTRPRDLAAILSDPRMLSVKLEIASPLSLFCQSRTPARLTSPGRCHELVLDWCRIKAA